MDSISAHPEQISLQHGINQRVNHSPHVGIIAARPGFALDVGHRAQRFAATRKHGPAEPDYWARVKPATGIGDFLS